jgi:hypothetical protein
VVGGFKYMTTEFKFIPQKSISKNYLQAIVKLKALHWKYSDDQHLDWIEKNLNQDDIHILLLEKSTIVGYLNLVNITVLINNCETKFLGVGNVCTRSSGLGYGKQLLLGLNCYLDSNKLNGILLCKDELVPLYAKYDWRLVLKEQITTPSLKIINVMLYNYNKAIELLEYNGRNF